MGRAKPDPYKQHISGITPPPEHTIPPRDPEIYLSTSPWQIMTYEYELEQKRLLLQELFPSYEIPLPATDGRDFHYRNKMEYTLYWDNAEGKIRLAFHQRNSHRKIPFAHSSIERPEILARAKEIVDDLNAHGEQARTYQSLLLRCDQAGKVSGGLLANHQPHPTFPPLTDRLLGHPYTYSPNGFFQINLPVYELALAEIAKRLGGTEKVLDLYAGVGTIGLSVARDRQLTLVETNEAAYAELVKNCTLGENLQIVTSGGISSCEGEARAHPARNNNLRFSSATPVLAKSEDSTDFITRDTTVILDPPRAGLHPKLTSVLSVVTPPKIIYLSCNPVTQARDVAALAANYTIAHIQPFNFFPRTPHTENLIVLTKK